MRVADELLPRGRLGRAGFWGRHLIVLPLALFVAVAVDTFVGGVAGAAAALLVAAGLASAWGRRLHDRGRSAWWLLAAAVPVLGALWLAVECGLLGARASADRFGPVGSPGTELEFAL